MGVFKAYDIRGIYDKDFDKNDVYKIGFFLPHLLNSRKILIGRDVRTSSDEVFEYLCKGIIDAGVDVDDMGLATTPMVYYCTARYNYDASVQITASHNPKEYNGLKISKKNALPVGYESGLADLEAMIKNNEPVPISNKGKITKVDYKSDYIQYQKQFVPDFSSLKIGIDCSNGMAALIIKEILGAAPLYLFDELDGTFPNHEPNPLEEHNVEALKKLVKEKSLDIGIIYDGDADRVMFVDEKVRFVPPDLIIAVLGNYFLTKEKGNVIQDIRTSKSVELYVNKLGGTTHTWKVGHAYAKYKLREINGIYGGELAGHYYFRDFYYCDSGILASLLVLNVILELKKQNISFASFIDSIKVFANSGEINFKINQKLEAMEALKTHFTETETVKAFYDFDGYRIEFEDWWFNVRPSNTEPYLRLVCEAKTQELLQQKVEQLSSTIKKFN